MKKKTAKAGDSGKKKAVRKGAKGSGKGELSPMDRMDALIEAAREERKRNPPKTDHVLPTGEMLPVPAKLLTTEKDVLGMYDHLHEFCANSIVHDHGIVYRDHNNPVDCLTHMYKMGCVCLWEMRAILQIPLQIRWLHECLYRYGCWETYPYRQFVVEFVEMLRFLLMQHGYVRPADQPVLRHSYSFFPGNPKPDELPFTEDVIAISYEGRLAQDKTFIAEWEELRLKIPVRKWVFACRQNWYLAFNSSNVFDRDLTRSTEHEWIALLDGTGAKAGDGPRELKSALNAFCSRWALTHVGTPFEDNNAIGQVLLRAERVDVLPMREDNSPVPNVLTPLGHEVRIPKYYAFSHIQEYYDKDFSHLKYVMQLTESQRKARTEIPIKRKIRLLRELKAILKRSKVHLYQIFLIQKRISGISGSTLGKMGFKEPMNPSTKYGPMFPSNLNIEDIFQIILNATVNAKSDQRSIFKILMEFKIHVDFHLHDAEHMGSGN